MIDQLFELNLPKFEEIVNPHFLGFNDNDKNYNYYWGSTNELKNILKPEWQNFFGINWDFFLYFKKSSVKGAIHTDLGSYEDYNSMNKWGINWVFNGDGIIKFWKFENVVQTGMTPGSFNIPESGSAPMYSSFKKPDFFYRTLKNKVYLINASLPHQAIGSKNRAVFSLRATNKTNLKWESIVKEFSSLIKY